MVSWCHSGVIHQHSWYSPPAAVTGDEPNATLAPLAKLTAKPALVKRGRGDMELHVSRTMILSPEVAIKPRIPSKEHVCPLMHVRHPMAW